MTECLSPLQQWAQSSPSLCALETPQETYSWQSLYKKVTRVANGLREQGIGSGDVVTCVGKNSLEQLLIYLACLELGAICALTMPQTESELSRKLETLYETQKPAKLWSQSPELSRLTNLDFVESDIQGYEGNCSQDNLASIVFTSGSTGTPKAVAHTSRQHLASASGLLEKFTFKQGDSWLLSLPMYHVSGLAIVYRWLFSGATLKVGSGKLEKDIIGVTHASLVATQLKRLLEDQVVLNLTHVLLGGSHVPLALSQQAARQGIETWLGYGMTEAASTVTAKRIDELYSAGFVLPNRALKLEGQRIFIGGETLASGYYHQGLVTPFTDEGWFDTKDLGEWKSDELSIIGRADNLFISGGENVHCEEIEAALMKVDGITQAIVMPVEDAEFGQRPVAVCDFSLPLSQGEIEAHLKGELTKFKWPKAYFSMPDSFKQSGIKVSRKLLKEWLTEQK